MKCAFLIVTIALFCCTKLLAQSTDAESSVGVFQGEKYSNQYLGFSFKPPAKWYIPTKDQINKYLEKANSELKTGDPKLDSKSVSYEKIEFTVSKKKIDAPENSLIGFSLLKQANPSATAKAVAEATRNYFLKVPGLKLIREISTERLGNRDFVTFELGVNDFPNQRVRIYITMVGEYTLTFALTYWDEETCKLC